MTVIRRYTPPTCTLEIKAKQSPLSRWSNRPLFKDIRFQLRFDDPRMIQDEQLEITGDRHQLELLCDVVTEYVQKFLHPCASFDYLFPIKSLEIVTQATNNQKDIEENEIKSSSNLVHLPSIPYLKSQSLISHELYFGSLIPDNSHISIKLSALQLFDLATALDNYQNDLKALPDLTAGSKASRKEVYSLWRNVAGIILTVGLTTVGLRYYYDQNTQTDQVAITEQTSENLQKTQPDVVAPDVPLPPPNAKLPQFKPLESGQMLPPPTGIPSAKSNGETGNKPGSPSSNLPAPSVEIRPNLPPPPPSALPEITVPLTTPSGNPGLPSLPSLPRSSESVPTFEGQQNEEELTRTSIPSPAIASNPSLENEDSAEIEKNNNVEIPINSSITNSLTEIKSYFQERWTVPEQLTQTVQYRLLINQDGSMGQITPISSLSGVYLDRTNMPLMGEKFITPFNYAQNITIRLVLFPDGKVDVFQE